MAVQIELDEKIRLTRASHLPELRYEGRGSHVSTLGRWSTRGRFGVVLRTEMLGGVRVTTRRWVQQFLAEVTEAARQQGVIGTDTGRQHVEAEKVTAACEAAGI